MTTPYRPVIRREDPRGETADPCENCYQGLGCLWLPIVAIVCWTAYSIALLLAR